MLMALLLLLVALTVSAVVIAAASSAAVNRSRHRSSFLRYRAMAVRTFR